LWRSLETGAFTVIDQIEHDQRRVLLARENVVLRDAHAITPRERQIVRYASLGYSNKRIAYELAIEPSTVSTHLSHAAAKLGLQTRSAIIQTYAALAGDRPSVDVDISYVRRAGARFAVVSLPMRPPLPDALSPAEREVVARVFAGESNATISRARGVSTHTVANQIAAAMRKLNVGSRADLIAFLMRSTTP
jgi:DNA-binding CsgD family transcriptional regulator